MSAEELSGAPDNLFKFLVGRGRPGWRISQWKPISLGNWPTKKFHVVDLQCDRLLSLFKGNCYDSRFVVWKLKATMLETGELSSFLVVGSCVSIGCVVQKEFGV